MSIKSLDEVRKIMSRKYMGKVGIHGIGVRRKSNALCIYFSASASPEQRWLFEEIEREAAPYQVIKIEEDQPTIQGPSPDFLL